MIDTITQAFLHCMADQRRLAKGETLAFGPNHGLSIWINENNLRTKLGLAARNSGLNFGQVLSMIPGLAEYCAKKNIMADQIPNEAFKYIVYGAKKTVDAPQSTQSSRQGQSHKKEKEAHRREIEKLWKAPIHGKDENCDSSHYCNWALLNDVYDQLAARYTIGQLKSLRTAWPKFKLGIDWGDILLWTKQRFDDPAADDFMSYFSLLAKSSMLEGHICEADFRERGKGQIGLQYPYDEIRIKAVLVSRPISKSDQKSLTETEQKAETAKKIEKLEEIQKKYGWFRDTSGKLRHKDF